MIDKRREGRPNHKNQGHSLSAGPSRLEVARMLTGRTDSVKGAGRQGGRAGYPVNSGERAATRLRLARRLTSLIRSSMLIRMAAPGPRSSASSRYCSHCSYCLDHLPETRCPECGRSFDPLDPATFRLRPKGIRHWGLRVWGTLGTAGVVLLLLYPKGSSFSPESNTFPGPLWLFKTYSSGDKFLATMLTVVLTAMIFAVGIKRHVVTVLLCLLGIAGWLLIGKVIAAVASV